MVIAGAGPEIIAAARSLCSIARRWRPEPASITRSSRWKSIVSCPTSPGSFSSRFRFKPPSAIPRIEASLSDLLPCQKSARRGRYLTDGNFLDPINTRSKAPPHCYLHQCVAAQRGGVENPAAGGRGSKSNPAHRHFLGHFLKRFIPNTADAHSTCIRPGSTFRRTSQANDPRRIQAPPSIAPLRHRAHICLSLCRT
jgi:hypothetical protein